MPMYTFIHKKTKKTTKSQLMTFSEMEDWLAKHPNHEVLPGAPPIHSGVGLGLRSERTDDVFKDKLRQIDKKNPGNTLKNYAKF